MTGVRIFLACFVALLLAACGTTPTPEYSCLQDRAALSSPPLDVLDASDIAALADEDTSLVLMKVTVLGAGEHAGRLGEAPSNISVGFGDFASAAALTGVNVPMTPAGPTAASGWAKFHAYPGTVFAMPQPWFFSPANALRIDPPVRAQIVYAGEVVVCSLTAKGKSSGFSLGAKQANYPVVSYDPREHRIQDIIMEPQPVWAELKTRYPDISSIVIAAPVRHEGRVIVRTFEE